VQVLQAVLDPPVQALPVRGRRGQVASRQRAYRLAPAWLLESVSAVPLGSWPAVLRQEPELRARASSSEPSCRPGARAWPKPMASASQALEPNRVQGYRGL
jgi:hypothetical protein